MKVMEVLYGRCTATHGGYMGDFLAFVIFASDSANIFITPD